MTLCRYRTCTGDWQFSLSASPGADSILLFPSRGAKILRQKYRPIPLSLVEAFSRKMPV